MKNNWVYLFGKVAKAVEVLATNPHEVKERVWVASKYLFMLSPESVPPSCRDDVRWIQRMLTRHPPSGYDKNALDATYRRTRPATAAKIARRIWTLYHVMETAVDNYLVERGRRA